MTALALFGRIPAAAAPLINSGLPESVNSGLPQSSSHGYLLPVPAPRGLTSVLGQRFNPPPQNWLSGHRGVDLLAAPGTVVVSPAPGVVSFSGKVAGKPVVSVLHVDGLLTSFEPVVSDLKKGTQVAAGTPVGTVDYWPAGTASHCPVSPLGACVHWGVRRGEIYLDPLSLLGAAPPIVLLPE